MKTLRTILFGVLGLAAIVALVTFLLPAKVSLQRETEINRAPSLVYAFVSDINGFNQFSPWKRADPAMTNTITGPAGAGQKMVWQSKKMGDGSMSITEAKPYESVAYDLDFGRSKAKAWFKITPTENGSKVVWGMDSLAGFNPVERVMNFVMKGLIAKDYDAGLVRLKVLAEELPNVDLAGLSVSRIETQPRPFIYVPLEVSAADPKLAEETIVRAMRKAQAVLIINELNDKGPGVVLFTERSGDLIKANAGFIMDKSLTPEDAMKLDGSAKVMFGELPGGSMLRAPSAPQTGDATIEKLKVYLKLMRLQQKGDVQQAYPGGERADTEILVPVS